MGILIQLVVFIVVIALVFYLIGMLPLDARLMQVVRILVVLICLVFLMQLMFGTLGGPAFNGYRWR